ncbi:hypothetical protein KSP35_20295 [Aquihabitans sp. G128]|uniref:hypothetical protein n=1 Tax=Aquihabitans sp. G128 TaxID=2849779 RepID=UPI001C24F5BF|nr:hypothetical protein [Aquihabitans sp. G128]QXC60634.1 hypothetical protein KSP35_20295 [Aquihabitans sp. G128]
MAVGSVYVVAPASMAVERFADRLVFGGLAGVLVGRAVAISAGQATFSDPLGGIGGDVEFWFVVGVLGAFVALASRPGRWRKGSERLSDVAPCLLAAFGVFQVLCWLRSYCSPTGAPRFGLELMLGGGLVALALALHVKWSLSPNARTVLAVGVIAGDRLLLASGSSGLAGAWMSALVLAGAIAFLGLRAARGWRLRQARRHLLRG